MAVAGTFSIKRGKMYSKNCFALDTNREKETRVVMGKIENS